MKLYKTEPANYSKKSPRASNFCEMFYLTAMISSNRNCFWCGIHKIFLFNRMVKKRNSILTNRLPGWLSKNWTEMESKIFQKQIFTGKFRVTVFQIIQTIFKPCFFHSLEEQCNWLSSLSDITYHERVCLKKKKKPATATTKKQVP